MAVVKSTVITKIIDTEGNVDPDTAILHEGITLGTDKPISGIRALSKAMEEAMNYVEIQYEAMGTDTFEFKIHIDTDGVVVHT
jgi:hypothetical protein